MTPTEAKNNGDGLSKRLVKDVHAELREALVRANLWESLDYFEISMALQKRDNAPFPSFEWLSCAPVSSGGQHYVYVGAVFKGRYNLIFVGKISNGFHAACEVANRCAYELGA